MTDGERVRPCRVAHLIHSLEPGGAESVLVELARVAPSAGLEMAVVPLVRGTHRRIADRLEALGVPVLGCDLGSRWDPRAFPRAIGTVTRWGPDVIHTHLKHADLVGAVVARRLGVPQVSTLHVVDAGPGLLERGKRRLAGRARTATVARTIAVSRAQRDWYLAAFPDADADATVVIPNGVADPLEAARPGRDRTRAALDLAPEDCALLQVGMLRPGKGHHTLLDALRRLRDLPRVRVLVAGSGELSGELAEAARGLPVTFLGFRDDVPDLLAAVDVVVHPSEEDALPTALIEAMAAGRPVVASDVGGIPEIVGEGAGLLVPPRDPAALAAALRGLATDPVRRAELGRVARSRYESGFAATEWATRLAALYDEIAPR